MKSIKRHKLVIGLTVAVLAIILVAYYHFSLSAGPAQQILQSQQNEEKLIQALNKLYQDDQQIYPRFDINKEDLQYLEDKVEQYTKKQPDKAKKLNQLWQQYQRKVESVKAVQTFYQAPILDDRGNFTESSLKSDLNLEKVREVDQQYSVDQDPDAFQEKINQLIQRASSQVELQARSVQELTDLDHLPVTPDYQAILAKALNDIFEVLQQFPSKQDQDQYQRLIDSKLTSVIDQVQDWPQEAQEELLKAVPELKAYLEQED